MTDLSAKLQLPFIQPSQAQKHVTHNEALLKLDGLVQMSVASKDLATPPGAPVDGESYIVPAGATGAWAGQDGNVAIWQNTAWMFYAPSEGWTAWVSDLDTLWSFDGSAWVETAPAETFQNIPMLGVNATADATNRLSVNSPAVLFNNEGTDIQVKLNKNGVADTASFLFQAGWSGRAEIGLTGDDDFHFKASPDGATWYDGLVINKNNGYLSLLGVSGSIPIYNTGGSVFIGESAGANDDLSNNYNTFVGYFTGNANTTGSYNLAAGMNALRFNTTGSNNVAAGADALRFNTTGSNNVAAGVNALYPNTTGSNNVAAGSYALRFNTTGSYNVAAGMNALRFNTTGGYNVAAGMNALRSNTTGGNNVGAGVNAGRYVNAGTDNATSSNSTYIGYDTRASADGNTNETVIGYAARGNGSNTVTLGNSSVTGAFVQVAWTVVSDRRDKEHVGDVPLGLDFVNQLRPAAFRYTEERGGAPSGPVRYGFYAQDVLALENDPVIVDASDPDKLKLNETALIATLTNAVQELSARLAKLEGE